MIFTIKEPQNRSVYILFNNGEPVGYSYSKIDACIYCLMTKVHGRLYPRVHPIKGQLVQKTVSDTYLGWVSSHLKYLKHK